MLTAAFWNENVRDNSVALPRGILGIDELTTAFSTSSPHSTFQDTGLSSSVTYEANRRLRVDVTTGLSRPGGANNIEIRILRTSTEVIRWFIRTERLETTINSFSFSYVFNGPATSGTETFKLQIGGTSDFQVGCPATATQKRQIVITDLGLA